MQKQKNKNTLKSWLFNKPVAFVLVLSVCMIVFSLISGFIDSVFNLSGETSKAVILIFAIASFIYSICYLIKKLPHDNMYRNDFIAIVNGANIISLVSSLIAIFSFGFYTNPNIEKDIMFFYFLHPTLFVVLSIVLALVTVYLIGVAVSGIYAKYKRCKQMGIDTWKIILSMPFSFLMLWTPGYLIDDKNKKSVLEIKTNWYSKFNKWVIANFSNTLFVFLFLLLCKNVISGSSTLLLSISLLILYTLWYVKHKSDFIKNINQGYAVTAVGINLSIIIALLLLNL